MLTKSQAKAFFLVGTIGFSAIFVGLTIDTINKVPKQTNAQNLTPEVVRGKHLWDAKNCMGCHTLMGEGGYYAPELTKVYERRGEAFIKAMLKDPQAMYPGERKMVKYDLTEQQMSDMVAFFKWVGEMDLNGFPPKPDLVRTADAKATGDDQGKQALVKASNRPQVFNQMCVACHSLDGQGGNVGPALDGVGAKFDRVYIEKWITNPSEIKADSKMPKLPLSKEDIVELGAFLTTLKGNK